MCRLVYIPRPFDGLHDWLLDLEASCGGHGTGVAVGDRVIKGREVSAAYSYHEIVDNHNTAVRNHRKRLPYLWHTRYTSSGGHHDSLCHPFKCAGGWLVHNGHWSALDAKAKAYDGPMSDTRLFSLMVNGSKDGFVGLTRDLNPPGVWLHMLHDGRLAIHKGSGSLVYCPELGAYCIVTSGKYRCHFVIIVTYV